MCPEPGVCVRNTELAGLEQCEGDVRKVEKLGAGGLTGLGGYVGFYSEKGHHWRVWSRGGTGPDSGCMGCPGPCVDIN